MSLSDILDHVPNLFHCISYRGFTELPVDWDAITNLVENLLW